MKLREDPRFLAHHIQKFLIGEVVNKSNISRVSVLKVSEMNCLLTHY